MNVSTSKSRQSVSSHYKFRLDIHIHNTLLIFISLIILCTPMTSIYVDVSSFPSFAPSRHTEDASALVEANTKVRVYFSSYSSYSSSFSFFSYSSYSSSDTWRRTCSFTSRTEG